VLPDPSASMWSDKTTPSLRGVEGVICTICRRLFPTPPPGATELARCPDDRAALVDVRAFTESGEDALLGLTVAGRFTVLARLGAGSMGTVYRARQEGTGRDVALKILRGERAYDASSKARFEREARANSVLASPYTVTVFDFGVAEDGSLFLAMEMLEGESLGHRLRREKRMSPREAVRFSREALLSLAEAHRKGIIHRDIKPDNLFLARAPADDGSNVSEICKVLDFGIAKVVRDEGGVDALQTQAGTVFGTPRFMSPEQAQGKPLDARSDLYSLGIILYQMLTGRPPFEDEDAVIVMAQHIKSPPPPMAEVAPDANVPPALEQVVLCALSKDPAHRPASAEQFVQMLEQALATIAVEGSGVRRTVLSPLEMGRRRAGVFAATGAGVLVISGLVGWLVWGREPVQPTYAAEAPAASTVAAAAPSAPAVSAVPEAPPVPEISAASLPSADEPKKKASPKADRGASGSRPKAPPDAPAPTAKPSKYGRFE
jgi:eukaryotic-like serine/threonine-protein kinase